MEETLLDNPIWNSLRTRHAELAEVAEPARRYPFAIGPLSGIPDQSAESYAGLERLAAGGDVVVLFLQEKPEPPAGWTLIRGGELCQMIQRTPKTAGDEAGGPEMVVLGAEHNEEMVALATLTEPGPFRTRTRELGTFYGIFDGGRLAAMAGMRTSVPGFTEVSAVCTHPEARGRGYAQRLTARVAREIHERGETPYLHAFAHNLNAIRVYERLGFVWRRAFELGVLKREG